MLPNLKKLRLEYNISQQKLADAIGVSQPSINKYENHDIEPDIAILKEIAAYFDTSIDYIVGYSDERIKPEHREEYHLTRTEREFITRFRSLKKSEKECIQLTVNTFLNR